MAEHQTPEGRDYHSDVRDLADQQAQDIKSTAEKIPADKSEQKVTRSTEGSAERTTQTNERKK